MSKRDLTSIMQNALNKAGIVPEPPLTAAYKAAVMVVCNIDYVNVGEWDYPRFATRQKELDVEDIEYNDYAASVVKTWWGWCKLQGMRRVSIPIFCGPKAFARYKRDKIRHSLVEIDTLSEEVHQARVIEETAVATLYLGGYPFRTLYQVRSLMENFHTYPPEPDIVEEVIELMNQAYGLAAENYHQLAVQYRKRYGKSNSSETDPAIQVENSGVFVEARMDA